MLVGLLADPAGLDGAGELLDRRLGRQVGEVVLALACRSMFPDQPDCLAGQMLCTHIVDTLRRSVCDPHTNRGKAGRELAFGATPPTDLVPFRCLCCEASNKLIDQPCRIMTVDRRNWACGS